LTTAEDGSEVSATSHSNLMARLLKNENKKVIVYTGIVVVVL